MPPRRAPLCNFFAILTNDEVRKIDLTQNIIPQIRTLFVEGGEAMFDDVEEIEFTGNYKIDKNEILYVELELPQNIQQAVHNPIGVHNLNPTVDDVRALFWFEDNTYYFQTFDKRKLLRNKSIIFLDNQTYNLLDNDGLIIDNAVHAVYKGDKYYFLSYANANKIFSLADFYKEATDEEIRAFGGGDKVSLDEEWFLDNTNSAIRKQITLLQKSNVLDAANTRHIRRDAREYGITVTLDGDKICFPNNKKECKDLLLYLNEQYWKGAISGTKFKTTSKRPA